MQVEQRSHRRTRSVAARWNAWTRIGGGPKWGLGVQCNTYLVPHLGRVCVRTAEMDES
ncbi:hypothetical protein QQF64_008226, partial [Cirrhinus molitorella]